MFILLPLTLILASALGIFVVIWRKMPYLRKLSVTDTNDIHPSGTIWTDFFPELAEKIKNFNLDQYKEIWLIELEKFLRRLRLISLKTDRFSDSLIKKIRNFTAERAETIFPDSTEEVKKTSEPIVEGKKETTEDWKKEEQRLIIEVAKNPKDYALYEKLGDLYMKMGSFSDAKESYEAAIELNPAKEELQEKHSQAAEKVLK